MLPGVAVDDPLQASALDLLQAHVELGTPRTLRSQLVADDDGDQLVQRLSLAARPLGVQEVQFLQDAMDPAPALAVVVLELGPVVERFERERVAEEELERAEDERFELAGAEAMLGTELAPDPPDRPGSRSRPS